MMERRGGQGRAPGHPGGVPAAPAPKPQEPPVQ
jgi:hypothetical protein